MIDPSLMPELPESLIEVASWDDEYGTHERDAADDYYDKDMMRAYGLQCYQLAMERAADLAYDAAIRYAQGYAVDFKAEFALQEKTNG